MEIIVGVAAVVLFIGFNALGKKIDHLEDVVNAKMQYDVNKSIADKE